MHGRLKFFVCVFFVYFDVIDPVGRIPTVRGRRAHGQRVPSGRTRTARRPWRSRARRHARTPRRRRQGRSREASGKLAWMASLHMRDRSALFVVYVRVEESISFYTFESRQAQSFLRVCCSRRDRQCTVCWMAMRHRRPAIARKPSSSTCQLPRHIKHHWHVQLGYTDPCREREREIQTVLCDVALMS